jgi:hypothetical protein
LGKSEARNPKSEGNLKHEIQSRQIRNSSAECSPAMTARLSEEVREAKETRKAGIL